MRSTHATVQVALALASDAASQHWGYDLSKRAGVRSGVMYPVLQRMLDAGWLTDGWERADDVRKRPRRRYYQLTDQGRRAIGALLSEAATDARFIALFPVPPFRAAL